MIRVLSVNLQRGLARDGSPTTSEQLAAAFAGIEVDVVAMQEVDRGQPRSGGLDQSRVVAAALGLPHVRFAATLGGDVRRARVPPPSRWGEADGPAYGLAIASRWPVAAWFVRPLPRLPARHPVLRAGRLRLRDDEQRGMLATVLRTPAGALSIATVHLSLLGPVAAAQIGGVLRSMSSLPSPSVVCGDLNLDPWAVRPLARGWQMPRARTYPATGPRRQLDHVLVRGARVVGADALALPISDHLALGVTVAQG